MSKYSYEQRLETVLLVTEKQMSYKEAAGHLAMGETHVRRWVKRYEQFGAEGLLLKHGSYTGEFKQHVIEYMHENHLSMFETAVLFKIPTDVTVGKWNVYIMRKECRLFIEIIAIVKKSMASDKAKKEKLNKQTEEDLIAEVQRLRMENAYLKKLNALVQERISRENGKKQPPLKN